MTDGLTVVPVPGLPEIKAGDDLGALIAEAALAGPGLRDGDILVITSKVVSKSEGRVVRSDRESAIDAETVRVVARRGPTRISQTRHGLVLAAAGVDESNTEPGTVVLLPVDPDGSARRLRKAISARASQHRASQHRASQPRASQPRAGQHGARIELGVIITDTMGRPWRAGQTDTAIGAAGLNPIRDHRGQPDSFGNVLEVTMAAVADEIAAAADLVKQKTTQIPVAIVRGLAELVTDADGPGAVALIRPAEEDMFRLGAADVVTARRTVREFTAAPVAPEAVRRAIAAAITAPAPHHSQPWRFAVLESQEARTRLLDDMLAAWRADLAGDGFAPEQIARRVRRGEVLRRAPLIIVPCLVADAAHEYPDDRRNAAERAMFLVAMGAGVENLLVALAVEGLGSCWVSSTLFCRDATVSALGLPPGWEPMGAVGVGVPAAPAPDRPGRDPDQFTLRL
jgi:coenzyme F420-0:L-glutamate ligase / coenzyme F420-1:gamma-L-glutamate ligase